jgi:prevent-host-death family protein
MHTWQVQEAKSKLSDLIRSAKSSPQLITVRGNPEVVVISAQQYSRLQKPELSLLNIMQKFPHKEINFSKARVKSSKLRKTKF